MGDTQIVNVQIKTRIKQYFIVLFKMTHSLLIVCSKMNIPLISEPV